MTKQNVMTKVIASNGDECFKVEYSNGAIRYYGDIDRSYCHNPDGPAVIEADGYKTWEFNGEFHRVDGPAIIYSTGVISYYIHGVYMTEKEHSLHIEAIKCRLDRIIEEELS